MKSENNSFARNKRTWAIERVHVSWLKWNRSKIGLQRHWQFSYTQRTYSRLFEIRRENETAFSNIVYVH